MSSAKHSPAPWRIKDDGRIVCYPASLETGVLASNLPDGEVLANAHLIAAAPELLEVLRATVAMIEHSARGLINRETGEKFTSGITDMEITPDGSLKLSDARAAIAKAEGRT